METVLLYGKDIQYVEVTFEHSILGGEPVLFFKLLYSPSYRHGGTKRIWSINLSSEHILEWLRAKLSYLVDPPTIDSSGIDHIFTMITEHPITDGTSYEIFWHPNFPHKARVPELPITFHISSMTKLHQLDFVAETGFVRDPVVYVRLEYEGPLGKNLEWIEIPKGSLSKNLECFEIPKGPLSKILEWFEIPTKEIFNDRMKKSITPFVQVDWLLDVLLKEMWKVAGPIFEVTKGQARELWVWHEV